MKTGAFVVVGVALVVCACGNKDEPAGAPSGAAATASQASGQVRTGDSAVAAVQVSQGAPVAGLWFEAASRPVAGQPFALKLLVSAPQPVPALRLKIDPQGLDVTPDSGVIELTAANALVAHEFTVTSAKAGLVELNVHLAAEEGSAETVYAIPVLVAEAK